MKFQMGDIETQVVCYENGTVAHRRQPISHQPQFSVEQLTELVRRWNAFEKDGIVDELLTAAQMGLNSVRGIKNLNHLMECSIKNEKRLDIHIEQIEAAIAKVKA